MTKPLAELREEYTAAILAEMERNGAKMPNSDYGVKQTIMTVENLLAAEPGVDAGVGGLVNAIVARTWLTMQDRAKTNPGSTIGDALIEPASELASLCATYGVAIGAALAGGNMPDMESMESRRATPQEQMLAVAVQEYARGVLAGILGLAESSNAVTKAGLARKQAGNN